MEIFERVDYVERIKKALGRGVIVVLTGQRRVGKSFMLKMMQQRLAGDASAHVIYIDKEKREFDHIKTYVDLNEHIAQHVVEGKHTYILIDEVQDIVEFEKSLRSWNTEPETDIIVTGSNAHMLSSELSTIIGGRYKEIHIQSLSYSEFLGFNQLEDNDMSLSRYINCGGMPSLRNTLLDDEEDVYSTLSDVLNTVLLKDVVMRNKIRNVTFLENFVRFVADNIGKLLSPNSISKYMKSQGVAVAPGLIIEYMRHLIDAFIVSQVRRFDIHGKRILEINDKYYFADHGLRNAIAGSSREGDIEKVIENVVYNELIRLGYKVFVGQLRATEIDFVAEKSGGNRVYIQVTYLIASEETRQREFGNLEAIQDNYPKYVISLMPMNWHSDYNGITHLHLRRFLTQGLE